jgi:hypothetical protein
MRFILASTAETKIHHPQKKAASVPGGRFDWPFYFAGGAAGAGDGVGKFGREQLADERADTRQI